MFRIDPFRTLAIASIALLPVAAAAQPAPAPEVRDLLLRQWTETSDKIIAMAEDFPEAKFDYRATPDVRTFADNLRHVAFWNQYVEKQLKGEKLDPAINELAKTDYPTRAKIVQVLKESAAAAAAALKAQPAMPSASVIGLFDTFTEHAGEHYGQLVVYYRLNGLVPPESRPKRQPTL